MAILNVPITTELPGFKWKGHAPLTVRNYQPDPTQRLPGTSLFPIAVAFCQPPSPVSCLSICELYDLTVNHSSSPPPSSIGVLVGMGSAHGFGLIHLKLIPGESTKSFSANLVLHHSTIPANAEALEEASVGDGWARRRTRELKNSLRDSFRRLKRMKSGRSTALNTNSSTNSPSSSGLKSTALGSSPVALKFNEAPRVGLRKSVTRSTSAATRTFQIRGDSNQDSSSRIQGFDSSVSLPAGGEREICDRPVGTANTALVRCITFGPPVHHRLRPPPSNGSANPSVLDTHHLLGSFFAGTSGGAAFVYAIFTDNYRHPSCVSARQANMVQLQHRAPIVTLRLIDTKTHCPLMTSSVYPPLFSSSQISSPHSQQPPPHLVAVSEEQVRLFALPVISLRQKVRITAKDGFRIKTGDIMAFGQVSTERSAGLYGIEFNCVFTNNGGQAIVLSVPHLRRRDTISLLASTDILEVDSVVFASAASTQPKIIAAPSLGMYQTAPGQLAMFDVVLAGQRCSALGTAYRIPGRTRRTNETTPTPSPRLQQRLVKSRTNTDPSNTGSLPDSDKGE